MEPCGQTVTGSTQCPNGCTRSGIGGLIGVWSYACVPAATTTESTTTFSTVNSDTLTTTDSGPSTTPASISMEVLPASSTTSPATALTTSSTFTTETSPPSSPISTSGTITDISSFDNSEISMTTSGTAQSATLPTGTAGQSFIHKLVGTMAIAVVVTIVLLGVCGFFLRRHLQNQKRRDTLPSNNNANPLSLQENANSIRLVDLSKRSIKSPAPSLPRVFGDRDSPFPQDIEDIRAQNYYRALGRSDMGGAPYATPGRKFESVEIPPMGIHGQGDGRWRNNVVPARREVWEERDPPYHGFSDVPLDSP